MSQPWIIVPVKGTRNSKQRLAACLDPDQRRNLALVMLEDVLAAIAASAGTARCVVVTADHDVSSIAARYGARTLAQAAHDGHTGAVEGAAHVLASEGVSGFLTLPGDVPLLSATDVTSLLAAHRQAPAFTIAPSHDELGSNAVACSPPGAVRLRFGDNSFFPHLAAARAAGIEPTILHLPGVALDIDTPEDLARFMRLGKRQPTRTHRYLQGLATDHDWATRGAPQ